MPNRALFVVILLCCLVLSSCALDEEVMIKEYSEVILTKNNELQIRFTFNEKLLPEDSLYKVKILFEDPNLQEAVGTSGFFYGQESTQDGITLAGGKREQLYLTMKPIPLRRDFHPFELEEMIQNQQAIKIEVYQNNEVIGTSYITNFVSQL